MALNVPNLQALASGLPKETQQALRSALAAQDKFNRDVNQSANSVEPGPWVRPAYLNNWVDLSSTRYIRYRLENLSVRMEGTMALGTVGGNAFILPPGYRPFQSLNFSVSANGAYGNVLISADGTVNFNVGSNVTVNLNLAFAVG